MRPNQPQASDETLGQTRLGLTPKPGADARPAHPRHATAPAPAASYSDWALI